MTAEFASRSIASVVTIESTPAATGSSAATSPRKIQMPSSEQERERDQLGAQEVALATDVAPARSRRRGRRRALAARARSGARRARVAPSRRYAAITTDRRAAARAARPRPPGRGEASGGGRGPPRPASDDHDRRAGDDAGPLREQLERPVALGALVLVVVVARAQVRRRAAPKAPAATASTTATTRIRARTAPREFGEKGEHRIGHNA